MSSTVASNTTSKENRNSASDRRFQQALFTYHRGDYSIALREFEKSAEMARLAEDHSRFVESCTYILRILAEREEFGKIERIEERVTAILGLAKLNPKLKSRAMYILGICACYQETRHDQAMNRFREAIDFAVSIDDKEALASPLYGAATVLYARGRFAEALKELSRLDILLSCLSLPELTSASSLLRSMILRNQGQHDEALEAAWVAYESLKHHPHLVLYLHTLCALGTIYALKGDTGCARLYLDLADRSLRRDEYPRIARLVDEALSGLRTKATGKVDLAFDTRTGILTERTKGEVRFEGQFILRDLLRAFLENPGKVFTKEDLARSVWREDYKPEVHDNKIYVTIKRLRKLLETEGSETTAKSDGASKTDYILRAKTGYFLNPKTRVSIDDQLVKTGGTL